MARFYFGDFKGLVIANGEYHNSPFSISLSDGFLNIEHFLDDSSSKGIIDIKDLTAYGVKVIDWQNDNMDVILKNTKDSSFHNIITKSFSALTASIYKYADTHASFWTDSHFFDEVIPNIQNARISFSEVAGGILIVVDGDVDDKKYLLMLIYNGGFTKLFSGTSDNIEFSNNGFITTEHIKDMLNRTRITSYSFNNTSLKKSVKFSYGRNEVKLIPYLFLEALRAQDYEKMESYLSDSIKSSPDTFLEYFSEFQEITCPKYKKYNKISDLTEVATINYNQNGIIRPNIYKFEMKDGLITNITT